MTDVLEVSMVEKIQELQNDSYAKGFADGKEEGLRVARQRRPIGKKGYVFGNNEQIVLPYDLDNNTLTIDRDLFERILHMISDGAKMEEK